MSRAMYDASLMQRVEEELKLVLTETFGLKPSETGRVVLVTNRPYESLGGYFIFSVSVRAKTDPVWSFKINRADAWTGGEEKDWLFLHLCEEFFMRKLWELYPDDVRLRNHAQSVLPAIAQRLRTYKLKAPKRKHPMTKL